MALLFMDGFDHYATSGDCVSQGKWAGSNGTGSAFQPQTSRVRTGRGGAQGYYSGDETYTKPLPASGGFVVGFALYMTSTPQSVDFIRIKEGTTVHVVVAITSASVLLAKNGSGTVLATGTTTIPQNSWVYIEFKGVIHDTTGSFEVRIDGATELTGTAVDTRNGGATGQWDRVGFSMPSQGWNTYYDDLYICDLSGASLNDFLGPVKIETLTVQAGNGSNVGLTPSTGTDHGAMVDDVAANTTDWNSGATVGLKDTYNLPSVTLTGGIYAIQTVLYVAKSDAGLRKVAPVLRTGGVDYDGADQVLFTTFNYVVEPRMKNPGTAADWTIADLNALEVGMKVTV